MSTPQTDKAASTAAHTPLCQLTSFPIPPLKADGSNYPVWSTQLGLHLQRLGVLPSLTNGTLHSSSEPDVSFYLTTIIEAPLLLHVKTLCDLTDACATWSTLHRLGSSRHSQFVTALNNRLDTLNIAEPSQFESVVTDAQMIFTQLASADAPVPESAKRRWFRHAISSCHFLHRALEPFFALATPDQSMDQFVAAARTALAARANTRCSNCGRTGHLSSRCRTAQPTTGSRASDRSVSNRSRTLVASERVSSNNVHLNSSSNDSGCRAPTSMKENSDAAAPTPNSIKHYLLSPEISKALLTSSKTPEHCPILDSGAAHTITFDEADFIPGTLRPVSDQFLEVADGALVPITAVGDVKWRVYVNDAYSFITLRNVKLAPTFTFKLISIPTLAERQCEIRMANPWLHVFKNSELKFSGYLRPDLGRLWVLVQAPVTSPTSNSPSPVEISPANRAVSRQTLSPATAYEWHLRLGHRNYADIFHMAANQLVHGMTITDRTEVPCEACTRAKGAIADLPRSSDEVVDTPGTLVGDILSFPEPGIDGSTCCSIFTDVATRFTLLQPLVRKDAKSVANHLKSVIAYFMTQTGHRVRKLITDNGLEYDNKFIKDVVSDAGVHHVFTAKYTPSQNGIAERKNRTIAEAVRAVLASNPDLDPRFWPHLAISCNHLQNLSVHSKLGKTPYEALFGRLPTVNYLRPLGCRVHVLKDGHLSKLETQREPAIFLGYEPNRRGYKIWNLNKGELAISRNVVFPPFSATPVPTTPEIATPALVAKRPIYDDENPSFDAVMKNSALRDKWTPAILSELDNMRTHQVWELVPFANQPLLTPKVVLREKFDENGQHLSYKARIVPRGFQQIAGRDYDDTFAPVAAFSTILTLLKLAVSKKMLIHHADFDAAFLNTPIKHDIFVKQVPHFLESTPDMVYKLKKCIYGLKQSPRDWWLLLSSSLVQLGWRSLKSDECVFVRHDGADVAYIVIYVDDLLLFASTEAQMLQIKISLASLFKMKDLGAVKHILGIRATHSPAGLKLDQQVLINTYFSKYGSGHPTSKLYFPLPANSYSHPLLTSTEYSARVGALSYLSHRTRPDISAVTNFLARRQHSFTSDDCYTLTRVFDYLKYYEHYGLFIDASPSFQLSSYVDADWGGDLQDRRSTSGSITFLGRTPISWFCRRQDSVALSTAEAELYAITEGAKDLKMAINLLKELGIQVKSSPMIYCDNKAAIAISNSKGNKRKVRHIDLRHFFIKEELENKVFDIAYIDTIRNKSDGLTKVLPKGKLAQALTDLGLINGSGRMGGAVG